MRLRGAPREKLKVRKPDWVWLNSVTNVFFFNRLHSENNNWPILQYSLWIRQRNLLRLHWCWSWSTLVLFDSAVKWWTMGKLWWVFNTFQTVSSGNLRWVPDLRPSHGNFTAYDKASKLTQKMYSAVFKLFVFDWNHSGIITPIYNRTHGEKVNIII